MTSNVSFEIEVYEKEDGRCPFNEFLDSLSPKLQAKLLRDLDLLEEFGNELREPFSKHLQDGIFELRTKFASDIARSLYFFFDGNVIVLTHGFVKKQNKTPAAEIRRAKDYRKDWLRRNYKHEL